MSVLIVEDDDRLMDALRAFLRKSGYATTSASDAAQALDSLDADTEVVLLDLGLPDMDGIELCRLIRQRTGVPIIIATARSHVQERIRGLRAGADDFVVKPYNVLELVARIEAVTRRFRTALAEPDVEQVIEVAGTRIDLAGRQLFVDGAAVELTRTEFDILAALARYPGVVVPRERIIREVWQTDWHAYSRSLEVHVGSVRRKTGRVDLIETVRGVGYRFVGS